MTIFNSGEYASATCKHGVIADNCRKCEDDYESSRVPAVEVPEDYKTWLEKYQIETEVDGIYEQFCCWAEDVEHAVEQFENASCEEYARKYIVKIYKLVEVPYVNGKSST